MIVVDGVLSEVTNEDITLLQNNPKKFWKDITSIGEQAFRACTDLASIKIPPNVKNIKQFAFANCTKLTSIKFQEDSQLTSIGDYAFSGCIKLTSIKIPSNVVSIGTNAFYDCIGLTSITVDTSNAVYMNGDDNAALLSKDGTMLHTYATAIGTSYTIPSSVKSIEDYTFSGCTKLTSITIPESVMGIAERAFDGCVGLTSITVDSENAIYKHSDDHRSLLSKDGTILYKYAPASGTTYTISADVTNINYHAFYGCSELTSLEFAQNSQLTNISNYAFRGCTNLTSLIIPANITTIGSKAFSGCRLKELVFQNRKIIGQNLLSDDIFKYMFYEQNSDDIRVFSDWYIKNKKEVVRLASSEENFDELYNKDATSFNNLLLHIQKTNNCEITGENYRELMLLAANLGIFEDPSVFIDNNNNTPVRDVAYTLLQSLFDKGNLKYQDLHTYLSELKSTEFNLEFLEFMRKKDNLLTTFASENNKSMIPKIVNWFNARKLFNLTEGHDQSGLPYEEENRYKIFTYKENEAQIHKAKWNMPTIELFKEEFAKIAYKHVVTKSDRELSKVLSENISYKEQKFFNKAKEILSEKKANKIEDHILGEELKKKFNNPINKYLKRTNDQFKEIKKHIYNTLITQKGIIDKIFTYEMLSKSSLENFSMGFYTSCCAKLYGAGAGAQRAMIVHPDLQPLVIRNRKKEIVCFGIIYVNRQEGYAIVNNLEMDSKYENVECIKKAIYATAIQGVKAFVKAFNEKRDRGEIQANKKITKVTCGLSPNGTRLNDYIKENPKLENEDLLKPINFDELKYAGAGSWEGDWFKNQYTIYEEGIGK